MKKITHNKIFKINYFKSVFFFYLIISVPIFAQVTLEQEFKTTDIGLYFDGAKVATSTTNPGATAPYDYIFGKAISPTGDCIKTYGDYVFMTWYKGGKDERNVMLTRYNTVTGTEKTIEFPHRHTGFQNKWWLGESHNSIAVGISPLDGTIHLLYDMHAYSNSKPAGGVFSDDYFRYSYSQANAASVSDANFTLSQFEQNAAGGYKHLSLNGGEDYANFQGLTYPNFFLNDTGNLFMYMREGGNNNGAYKFSKYDANTSTWSSFTHFNTLGAKNKGQAYNWGVYGNMKYINGKIRIGFQQRSSNDNDKYLYQNGIYYAYSEDQNGLNNWKNYAGESLSIPLIDPELAKVSEPGDEVQTTAANQVRIVAGFDWIVTDQGDVHFISSVTDDEFNNTEKVHTYKKAGDTSFTTTTNFSGAESIYTSGNNIYIIGLDNGKVFVEKAVGGTNNFTRVYEATSGKTFRHGKVHIKNGKLYYYLMENTTGSARPLYLQIIDLDIPQPVFNVSLETPLNNQNYRTGENIQLFANASTNSGTISKVEFWVDGQLYDEDTTASYSVYWSTQVQGSHTIQAIAYDNNNQSISSTLQTIQVNIDLTGKFYRLKNVATGRYLDSEGSNIIASTEGTGDDKQWKFFESDGYFNIDSSVRGIIRYANSSIINTNTPAPNSDADKKWIAVYENDGTYRFKTRNSTRYLYNATDNTIVTSTATNDRSKWQIELASTPINADLAGELFRFKNVETGLYLDSEGSTLIASISGDGVDKEWEFFQSGDYYNIKSSDRGVLRGASNPVGAVINTLFTAPNSSSDKQWVAISQPDGTYRFKIKHSTRYLYNRTDNVIVTSTTASDRSKWQIEYASSPIITVLTGENYKIRNFDTGLYLDSEGSNIIASVTSSGNDKIWQFFESGDYYNIDSNVRGVIRGNNSSIINTLFSPPNFSGDKQWIPIYQTDGSFRFKIKNSSRYLYNKSDNTIISSTYAGDRSKWILELINTSSKSNVLNINDKEVILPSVKVYPNVASAQFTISLTGLTSASITINDILGKTIYKTKTTSNILKVNNNGSFRPGLYLIRVIGDNQKMYNNKLIIR